MLIANREMMTLPQGRAWTWWGLYFENVGDTSGTITMTATGSPPSVELDYSVDGGRMWVGWEHISPDSYADFNPIIVEPGGRVCFRATARGNARFASSPSAYWRFAFSFSAAVGGNILSLLSSEEVSDFPIRTSAAHYTFNSLFRGNATLLDASALNLAPASLINYCYYQMFFGCYGMAAAPVLPATTMAGNCCESMFYNCYGMATAPALPATILASACYARMFYGCTKLTSAPVLPPASIQYCFYYMFAGCTGLIAAPDLTATTVPLHGYDYLFYGCRSLRSISTAQTAFNDCPSWVSEVAASGTFTCPAALGTDSTIARGASACPNGWTVVNT